MSPFAKNVHLAHDCTPFITTFYCNASRACRVTKFHIKVLKNIIPDPKTKLFASLHPYNCRASQEPKQLCL